MGRGICCVCVCDSVKHMLCKCSDMAIEVLPTHYVIHVTAHTVFNIVL